MRGGRGRRSATWESSTSARGQWWSALVGVAAASAVADGTGSDSLRTLFRRHPDGIAWFARDGSLVEVNERFEVLLGQRITDLAAWSYRSFVTPEGIDRADRRFQRALDGERQSFLTEVAGPDGGTSPIEVTLVPDIGTDGRARVVFAIVHDRSQRVHAERERARALEQLDELVDGVGVGLVITGHEGRIERVNPAFCRLTGYQEQQLVGSRFPELVHPDDHAAAAEQIRAMNAGRTEQVTLEERYVTAVGDVVWVRSVVTAIRDDNGASVRHVLSCHDITEERAAAERLASADWLRRAAARVAGLGAWSVELPGYEVIWSDELLELIGGRAGPHQSPRQALEYYLADSRRRVVDAVERCAQDGTPFDLEAEIEMDDGGRIDVRLAGEPQYDPAGDLRRIIGTIQDITPLKRAAAARRRAADQLAALLHTITDGVVTLDRDWRVTYINPAAEQLVRADRSQLLGRQLWEALPSLVGTEIERALRRTVATGEVVEVERFHAASTAAWYDVQASPSDSGLTVVFRDVSAHVREERRLRAVATAEANAADELRSVDRVKNAFITAVSHELRTPLTVVSGMADTLVRLRGSADTATRERVEDSLAANARRLSELLDDLLDTDRLVRGVLRAERREVSLVELVEGVIGESGVADRVVFDAPPWLEVAADPVLVERSVRNLLENVEKYAPEGPVEVMLAADATGGFVLAVHDEGPGVPVDDAERIFEPFHRLDDHPQPGTGVGLSLVAEFARLHGGRAYADTSVQRGARIVVEVPGGPDAVAGATAGEQDPGVASG